jgi:orotidine-5'-phosphate decarboxylase
VSAAIDKLNRRIARTQSMLCVGLDPDVRTLPERFRSEAAPLFAFNRWLIEETADYAASFKCNSAFYEAHGAQGWEQLQQTAEFVREAVPDAFTICDAKRADIGNTNRGYVQSVFDELGFDAITLHPYLGREALRPFLDRADKASIVLCRTSNEGGEELQELAIEGKPLWRVVAERVAAEWNAEGNCMLVVGAQHAHVMQAIRTFSPEIPLLVPGVGAQGGYAADVVRAGLSPEGRGLLINVSRGIAASSDPEAAARKLAEEIEEAREAMLAAR